MRESGIVLAMILVVLLLGGTGIISFNLAGIYPQMLNGVGTILSTILLTLIIGVDLVFIVLIARTPNQQREARMGRAVFNRLNLRTKLKQRDTMFQTHTQDIIFNPSTRIDESLISLPPIPRTNS